MPCYTPLKAYRAPGGGVAFDAVEGFTDRPLELPCGQCAGCRLERTRQWAIRCVHESTRHDRNCFVTLTYDDVHLPPDGGLDVKDWQEFARRVRKRVGKFRYFHCGEYGDLGRPHLHAILFGLDFGETRYRYKKVNGNWWYRSPVLEDLWPNGFSTIGEMTFQSAAYVARYVFKKRTGKDAPKHYTRVDPLTGESFEIRPEYVTMSRRPGIGADWYDTYSGDVFPADEVIVAGKRYRPPRFYDNKLPEAELARIKGERHAKALRHKEHLTHERLRVRERIAERRIKALERNL